jgi:hypothetical protein
MNKVTGQRSETREQEQGHVESGSKGNTAERRRNQYQSKAGANLRATEDQRAASDAVAAGEERGGRQDLPKRA